MYCSRKMTVRVLSCLLSVFSFLSFAAEKKYAFDFERPVKKGDTFECFVKMDRMLEYSLTVPGSEKKMERHESVSVNFTGLLTIRETGEKGNMQKFLLKIHTLSGTVNGMEVREGPLDGVEMEADLSVQPASFSCTRIKYKASEQELILLRTIFPPASGTSLADLTGTRRELVPGQPFSLDTSKYREILARRKIDCPAGMIEGSAVFNGLANFRDIRCGKFQIRMRSDKVPGYNFRYYAAIMLPADPEQGPAVSISRDAKEFLTKVISSSNRFAAGGQMTLNAQERASVVMLPVKPAQTGKMPSGGFYDLLKQ